jgi:MFS family permease
MMPLYLARLYSDVPLVERGLMSSVVFAASLGFMPVGGWWTDWMTKKYGTYLGRCFPVASTRFVAAGAFVACCFLDNAWAITIALCVFSIVSDMGLPALWAYNLDVGRRNVGLVLGWGNMWGNLGAAVAPTILGDYVLKRFVDFDGNYTLDEAKAGYNAVFLTCAAVFVFIGIVSFLIDATKPVGASETAA